MTGAAALRLAVVGPTHPLKGGVAAHTTTLAHELAAAGHDVTLVSWTHLYPRLLYPGEQAVPGGAPDVEQFPRTVRALSWARPDTWLRVGRRLRDFDAVVVVHVVPAVVPAHLALLAAAGVRGSGTGHRPRALVVAHNVLPHEQRPGDAALVAALLRRSDGVLVHTHDQAEVARGLGAERVSVAALPPHLPGGAPVQRHAHTGAPRLLALGIVRDYKGVDLLLEALAEVPGPTLTVAGEMWGSAGERVRALAADPRLRRRVEVREGYVPADELAPLLARHDVLALTYRSATASQNALLGQRHGLVVLASEVGSFGDDVRDEVDGLLVPPGDKAALVKALERLAEPGCLERLRAGVDEPDLSGPWARYVGAIEALASPHAAASAAASTPGSRYRRPGIWSAITSNGGRLRDLGRDLSRRGGASRGRHVALSATDLPEWVRPSDLLAREDDAEEARSLARRLGLPREADPLAAWAALGALAAVLRLRDDGRRRAVVVDGSGSSSPFGRWADALGFTTLETGEPSDLESDAELEPGSVDVLTRLHPGGCDADDVADAMAQASWALRPGGLLSLTVPVGPTGADGALGPAEVRGVLARSDDLGFVLVGDLDHDLTGRLRAASAGATVPDAAYGILRLTLRRR